MEHHQNSDVGYNHLADNSGQAQLVKDNSSGQDSYTISVLGTESYRLEKDNSSMNQACKGSTLGSDNLHPIKFDDYMNQPYKSCDQTIDCPQQATYNISGLDSDYIRQKKDDDYTGNNSNILQQAGQGAVHAAQEAAHGASNMMHGATTAVKNTLGMKPDNNPSNPKV